MEIITAQRLKDNALGGFFRWTKGLPDSSNGDFGFRSHLTLGEIRAALGELDLETCTNADINAAGISCRNGPQCDECDREVAAVVRFSNGDENDFDLCSDCLTQAARMVRYQKHE